MKFTYCILFLTLLSNVLCAGKYDTWLSPPPGEQIIEESSDDQLGMGRLFVPAMSFSEWEPYLRIYNSADRTVIDDYRPGKSIFLKPGRYTLLFGSSDDPLDKVQKHFTINQHQTTIIEPDWAGLVVNVLDSENNEFIRYGYEIMDLETGISIGTKYSRDESSFDDTNSTWILPPAKYKLVKQGEPFNTIMNFTTFELKSGKLTDITVVVNDVGTMVGAGEIGILGNYDKTREAWRNVLNLKGSVTLNSYNDENDEENRTDISFMGTIDSKFIFDQKPYYLNFRQFLEEEFEKKDALEGFRVSKDELKFTNTAIYYFTDIFGLYADIGFETYLFSRNYYDITSDSISVISEEGSVMLYDRDKFKLSDSFTPIKTNESFGLNFTFIKSSSSNLYLRAGFGFQQNFNDNVYLLTSDKIIPEFTEQEDKFIKGLSFEAGSDFQFSGNITYNSTASFFYNLDEERSYNFSWDNNIIFKIYRYVSIDYNLKLEYDYSKNSLSNYFIYDNSLALAFSYYLNR
ncbi:MAG: hypothetical protein R6V47_06555 [Candidatus Delongbacteria bacterium]